MAERKGYFTRRIDLTGYPFFQKHGAEDIFVLAFFSGDGTKTGTGALSGTDETGDGTIWNNLFIFWTDIVFLG